MKRIMLSILVLFSTLMVSAQGVFDYNLWQKEHSSAVEQKTDTVISHSMVSPYLGAFYEGGNIKGFGATVGLNIWNITFEVSYLHGLVESYQIRRVIGQESHSYTYKPRTLSCRLGYDIKLADMLSVTPMVGVRQLMAVGTQANENSDHRQETGKALMMTFGARASLVLTRHLEVFAMAERVGDVMDKSELFDILREYKDINDWIKGTSLRIGVNVRW